MSRTDKTDPYWVKRNRSQIERHDHRKGVCTIGDPDAGWDECHREVDWYDPENNCGCPMCADSFGRKEQTRKRRREGRRFARNWEKEY